MEVSVLENLKSECELCRKCPLGNTRTNLVFGVGNPHAKLMFIGEAPGEQEDLSGVPFVGAAGKLFDKYLAAVGIPREDVYIANILKCRPPKNRDPLPEEQDACIDHLRAQVKAIRPKIIVCLGRISATRLISPDFKVTKQHGQFIEKNGTLMMGTFHPAALLRNPNQKPAALEDFIALREKIMEVCPETYDM
jgi:DNA polymerase